jgi:nuclease S1
MSTILRCLRLAALACCAAVATNTWAWGADGHRIVAEAAGQRLNPAARAQVQHLLALEPGATLVSVANWADETRSLGTAAWHYVNFPRGPDCAYKAARLCVEGNCVVGALERQLAVLASRAPDEERLLALKYVVHLAADVHQPLHAGYADDRGGNSWQLQAYERGSNLHALWDSGLIRNWPGGMSALRQAVQAGANPPPAGLAPAAWAEESCRIVGSAGFYPSGHGLDAGYDERWNPVLAQRLRDAAARLSDLLNSSLGAP